MDQAEKIRKAKTAQLVREAIGNGITPGEWKVACDSYGKVQHSKMACVYTVLRLPGGEYLHNVASRIPNWKDGKLIEAAPDLLTAAKALIEYEGYAGRDQTSNPAWDALISAIAKAEGRQS